MCEPVSIVGAAIGVAQMAAGASAAGKSRSAQKRAARENQANADRSAKTATRQNNQQAIEKKSARALEAIMERGRLRAGMTDTGLSGKGANQMYLQSLFNESTDVAAIDKNRRNANEQIENERLAGVATAGNQIKAADAEYRSSMTAGLLGFGGNMLGLAAGAGMFDKKATPNPYANRNRSNFGHG